MDEVIEESDEEINQLNQRIRCRQRQKLEVEQIKTFGTSSDYLTECKFKYFQKTKLIIKYLGKTF